ncbi:hypothetical protein G3T36_01745 [Diaminobutyricibacter tongyongensis]|uniref:Ribosomal oxygenase 2 n=1 Tax=Leifsonia tongyongensis TaxID=1268043 RepID=A0A6L9XTE9_9MICO|nr:cupin domain-containing protein [Diaminobutyricibacter tongyongensis]NEN04586.1 hypothetical protein [Diaminobutyricibacter tongyongensis]
MNPSQIAEKIVSLAAERASEQFTEGSIPATAAHGLISPARLGSFLSNPLVVRHPQVRVALGGKAVPEREFTTPRRVGTQNVQDGIDAEQVAKWLTRGATITVDSLEYLSTPVREICDTLTDSLRLPATATAYVTGPGRQGLSPHTDEEDVFVVQTSGTKSWIIDLAQRQEVATASGFPFNDQMQQIAPRLLQPGDMFYMPAGTPRVATAQHNLSTHITFSVERPRVRDILNQSLIALAASSPSLNRLQPWNADGELSAADILRTFESSPIDRLRSAHDDITCELPFGSWDSLAARSLNVSLRTELKVSRIEDGYVLEFPDFTMKVGPATGYLSERLAVYNSVLIDSADDELREILFHLIGRGAVRVSAAVPA